MYVWCCSNVVSALYECVVAMLIFGVYMSHACYCSNVVASTLLYACCWINVDVLMLMYECCLLFNVVVLKLSFLC